MSRRKATPPRVDLLARAAQAIALKAPEREALLVREIALRLLWSGHRGAASAGACSFCRRGSRRAKQVWRWACNPCVRAFLEIDADRRAGRKRPTAKQTLHELSMAIRAAKFPDGVAILDVVRASFAEAEAVAWSDLPCSVCGARTRDLVTGPPGNLCRNCLAEAADVLELAEGQETSESPFAPTRQGIVLRAATAAREAFGARAGPLIVELERWFWHWEAPREHGCAFCARGSRDPWVGGEAADAWEDLLGLEPGPNAFWSFEYDYERNRGQPVVCRVCLRTARALLAGSRVDPEMALAELLRAISAWDARGKLATAIESRFFRDPPRKMRKQGHCAVCHRDGSGRAGGLAVGPRVSLCGLCLDLAEHRLREAAELLD